MESTSESLLIRLKDTRDDQAWKQFVQIYTPLIFYWARRTGLRAADARDLVQEVLAIVFQKLPAWSYDPEKSFRGWLRTVTLNRHRELCRRKAIAITDVTQSAYLNAAVECAESTWDFEYRKNLIRQALEIVRHDFQPITWKATTAFMFEGVDAGTAAKENGLSVWTIYSAKARLLRRLREVLDGLLE